MARKKKKRIQVPDVSDEEKANRCAEEIRAACKRWGCGIAPTPFIGEDGRIQATIRIVVLKETVNNGN